MICDTCGQKMDPFGDDGMDDSELTSVVPHVLQSNMIKIKAACSNCGHIQYVCRPKIDVGDGD